MRACVRYFLTCLFDIILAAEGGHPDCIIWLLSNGADIHSRNKNGEVPRDIAKRLGHVGPANILAVSVIQREKEEDKRCDCPDFVETIVPETFLDDLTLEESANGTR